MNTAGRWFWLLTPVMKRTHFYNYHRPPPSLSQPQLSYCLHTHQQHILRTLVARGILFEYISIEVSYNFGTDFRWKSVRYTSLTAQLLQKCHQFRSDQVLRMSSGSGQWTPRPRLGYQFPVHLRSQVLLAWPPRRRTTDWNNPIRGQKIFVS